ncbi:hypothetical protein EV363DRAFT_1307347 [Boletus edulis]|nr:hypothetical protein EV363DRAFT_1307347 [Boletus edulis]
MSAWATAALGLLLTGPHRWGLSLSLEVLMEGQLHVKPLTARWYLLWSVTGDQPCPLHRRIQGHPHPSGCYTT